VEIGVSRKVDLPPSQARRPEVLSAVSAGEIPNDPCAAPWRSEDRPGLPMIDRRLVGASKILADRDDAPLEFNLYRTG
jgi:hypothetical protein